MFSMSTSKLVKVSFVLLFFVSLWHCGMTTRLPLRRFSLRKTVFPESLYILIFSFTVEDLYMCADSLLHSVAFGSANVSVNTKSVLSFTCFLKHPASKRPTCTQNIHYENIEERRLSSFHRWARITVPIYLPRELHMYDGLLGYSFTSSN